MLRSTSRREFLRLSSALPVAGYFASEIAPASAGVPTPYPTQPAELIQEMVAVSHTNMARVKALVGRQQTLAKAAWDWGFGDWETALGAASHIGNREIAEFLLANGAHPTIFSAAMLGQLDVVKTFIAAAPGIQRTRGPHSIPLLAHATAGGPAAKAVVDYLKSIQGADDKITTQPLTEADAAKLVGAYTFGVIPGDRIDVTMNKTQLQIGRPGQFPRGLFHLGSYEFCPVGAENVRIKFAESADAMVLTVHDPDVVLTANRPLKATA